MNAKIPPARLFKGIVAGIGLQLATLSLACLVTLDSQAQEIYPTRPIKLIVGFAPGGSADVTARIFAEGMGRTLGQAVIVENRAGAGGNLAAEYVAKASPDGYTLLFAGSSAAINAHLYEQARFDLINDFLPVGVAIVAPQVLSVHPKVARSVKELVSKANAQPGRLNYGTSGNGSTGHLAMERFKQDAKVFVTHIPYRGSAPMLNALAAGDIDIAFDPLASAISLHKAGKIRALAVTSRKRYDILPDVPTMAEAGFPSMELYGWFGILAPRATAPASVTKLNEALQRTLSMRDLRETLLQAGNELWPGSPQRFAELIKSDYVRFGAEIKRLGVKVD